uniref:Uncharacterized protein n=1 Tax=Arundo donax TaxID=35708 RepID=A0A0A8Y7L1_ARUDO
MLNVVFDLNPDLYGLYMYEVQIIQTAPFFYIAY